MGICKTYNPSISSKLRRWRARHDAAAAEAARVETVAIALVHARDDPRLRLLPQLRPAHPLLWRIVHGNGVRGQPGVVIHVTHGRNARVFLPEQRRKFAHVRVRGYATEREYVKVGVDDPRATLLIEIEHHAGHDHGHGHGLRTSRKFLKSLQLSLMNTATGSAAHLLRTSSSSAVCASSGWCNSVARIMGKSFLTCS